MDAKNDDQRLDKLLLRLLKMPPKSRAELAEALRLAKQEKPTRTRAKRASAGKRGRPKEERPGRPTKRERNTGGAKSTSQPPS